MLSHLSHVQLFNKPVDNSLPGFYRLVKQKYWSRLPFSPLEDIPNQGIKPSSLIFPVLADGLFTISAHGKPLYTY